MGTFLLRAAYRSRPQVFAVLHSDRCRVRKPPWTRVEGEALAPPEVPRPLSLAEAWGGGQHAQRLQTCRLRDACEITLSAERAGMVFVKCSCVVHLLEHVIAV